MKEELKLINVGNGKYILCLNDRVPDELLSFIERKLETSQIKNICLLPITIKETNCDTGK